MTYFDSKNKQDCNGCGVCALKCPQNAIKMVEDSEGFLYPIVDNEKCINCNLCKKICPNHDYKKNNNVKTYIAINNDKNDLKNSSSGGCFFILAKYVLSKNGIVFGVAYNQNLQVIHEYADNMKDARKFQGSKYVRSDLNNSYQKVKEFLNEDRWVLFSGTPCQCQGLKTYLGEDSYNKLITCEIICHANPSPKVFELYKKNLELIKGMQVEKIDFRTKKNGWKNQKPIIVYKNGEEQEDIFFYKGFINELFNRPSCHNCYFCSSNRLADFTIGDMWGITDIDSTIIDDDSGISLFCINTQKGYSIISDIKDGLFLKEVDTELAFMHNHSKNVPKNKNRDKFYKGISNGTINETNIIKNIKGYTKKNLIKRMILIGKSLIKTVIK